MKKLLSSLIMLGAGIAAIYFIYLKIVKPMLEAREAQPQPQYQSEAPSAYESPTRVETTFRPPTETATEAIYQAAEPSIPTVIQPQTTTIKFKILHFYETSYINYPDVSVSLWNGEGDYHGETNLSGIATFSGLSTTETYNYAVSVPYGVAAYGYSLRGTIFNRSTEPITYTIKTVRD